MARRNLILFLVAILAWSIYLGATKPWQGDSHARTAAQVGALYPQLRDEFDHIQKIVLTDETQKTTLQLLSVQDRRIGRGWMVVEKNFPLDYARLTHLLENLASIQTSDVVSVNPDKHEVYGVALGQGTRVQVFSDDNLLLVDWLAGSLRHQEIASGQKPVLEFYMRDARSDRVYLSGDALLPAVDPARWCEVHLLKEIEMDRVEWVERKDFQSGNSWRIERGPAISSMSTEQENTWLLTDPITAEALPYAGNSMASSIVGLQVADIIGEASGKSDDVLYGFPQDRFRVGIEGNVFLFELGKPASSGQRYLRVKNLPYIFTLSDFDVSQLRQPVERMLQED